VTVPADPLVVTLQLDDAGATFFETRRQQHFPADRNQIPAHVSLFHALPGEHLDEVSAGLEAVAADHAPFPCAVTGVTSLGRGCAYTLASDELDAVHAALAERFGPWLTAQDRQPFRAHVTVQNKVDADAARQTHAALEAAFEPFETIATGLELWWYRGGPWAPADVVPFAGAA
jgi:2'-5' RNA ligase